MSGISPEELDWKPIRSVGSEGPLWVKVSSLQWEQYLSLSPYLCTHPTTQMRAKTVANGGVQWREQCLTCGRSTTNPAKQVPGRVVPNWDETLEPSYAESVDSERAALEDVLIEQTLRIETGSEASYQEYLASESWAKKRDLVLKRDSHICQGCLLVPATEVHHLNYDDYPFELMFDLISLCSACHKRAHRKKLARLAKLSEAKVGK